MCTGSSLESQSNQTPFYVSLYVWNYTPRKPNIAWHPFWYREIKWFLHFRYYFKDMLCVNLQKLRTFSHVNLYKMQTSMSVNNIFVEK